MEVVDFNVLDPVPHTKTLAYLNNFVINTTQFLNRFSYLCEQKLAAVSSNVQRLEITMSILEAKLQSIEGLGSVAPSAASSAAPQPSSSGAAPQAPSAALGSASAAAPAAQPEPVAAPAPPSNVLLNKDAPQYATYFKMLRLGIPIPQIKMKMKTEGVDPDVIDAPDAPAGSSAVAGRSGDEGDAFSSEPESWESD